MSPENKKRAEALLWFIGSHGGAVVFDRAGLRDDDEQILNALVAEGKIEAEPRPKFRVEYKIVGKSATTLSDNSTSFE